MNKISKQFMFEKVLKIIEKRNDKISTNYFKSIIEFNPSENNYCQGYMRACIDIREDIISQILKEC